MSAAVRTDGPAMARSVRETVMRNAGANEQALTLNVETVEALWNSGLMQFMNPHCAGRAQPTKLCGVFSKTCRIAAEQLHCVGMANTMCHSTK